MVVDLHRVAALPEQIVLDGSHERALPFAVTLSELGCERNALRRVKVPNDVQSESRKTNWCGAKRALRLQAQSPPVDTEAAIRRWCPRRERKSGSSSRRSSMRPRHSGSCLERTVRR